MGPIRPCGEILGPGPLMREGQVEALRSERRTPGQLIRYWRGARGLSQMSLALDVGVSPRHMSFVETGRSMPSRQLLIRIAERLAVPAREENELLEAAGHARRHRQSRLGDSGMQQVRSVLRFLLDRHEPNSALVFDGEWNVVMANQAHHRALEFFLGDEDLPAEIGTNLLRLTFHPSALRRWIVNWQVVGPVLLRRVERELEEAPSRIGLRRLLDEVRDYGPVATSLPRDAAPAGVLLPVHLRKGPVDIRLFSILSTVGTALDITLQELRIESFFPADEESTVVWSELMTGDTRFA